MSYRAYQTGGGDWVIDLEESEDYLMNGLNKMQAIKLLHFINGGSLIEWSELYAILSDSENLE